MSDGKLTLDQVQQTFGQMATAKELFYDWEGLNVWLFKVINSIHSAAYDNFMLLVTELGNETLFLRFMAVLAVYAVLAGIWRKLRRRGGVKQHFIMWFGVFLVLSAGFVVIIPVKDSLKDYFAYPRPYVALDSADVTVVEQRPEADGHRSFPSGHVSFITLMVIGLWPVLSPRMRLWGGALIFLVAWSRIALGVHFPADTVGGFLITSAIVMVLRWLIYKLLRTMEINCGGG